MEGIYTFSDDSSLCFSIDPKIYSREIIFKAAYNFIDKYYISFSVYKDEYILASFKLKDNKNFETQTVLGEFYNELLHEALRLYIYQQTKDIRQLILGRALYSTCIINSNDGIEINPKDEEDQNEIGYSEYKSDSMGIRKSWFDES